MKILAVSCYTGPQELCDMALDMVLKLKECVPDGVELRESLVAQGAAQCIGGYYATEVDQNVGFAFGMNTAIEHAHDWEPDFVLCLNTDLQFPDKNWLRLLIDIARKSSNRILVPSTDSTAIRVQPRAIDKPSFPVEEMSAYCWLVPFKWCQFLKQRYGFWLFDEDFAPAYGEDNWTAYLFAKEFGAKPFRYVPRSFVKHLRARTSRTVKHDRKASSALLVKKLKHELETYTLSAHLKLRAKNLIKVLTP